MKELYDLAVIGAGPGGYEAALHAAKLGKTVAVIEKDRIGGTCLNRGCIPTKVLMHSMHLLSEMKTCEELGLCVEGVSYDFAKVHKRKNDTVKTLQDGIFQSFKKSKVDYFNGKAVIQNAGEIKIISDDGEEILHAEHILIATGSVPVTPRIPGLDLPGVFTSNELLDGEGKEFDKLVIIGGGVIGIEMASIYAEMGTKVVVIEAFDRILPNLEKEISRSMAMLLKKRGIDVHTSAKVLEIKECGQNLEVIFEEKGKEQAIACDGVLAAIGRRANIEGLFADDFEIETERGAVVVKEDFATSVPEIYAVGDAVFGNIQLAHVATAQGIYAVDKIFGIENKKNLHLVPSCIYTNPEIAAVGINPDQAKDSEIPMKTTKYLMGANGKSLISREERSFMKVIYEEESKKIVGASLMCARATDMISEFALAIEKGLTMEEMASIIRPHPTYAEAITEAVEI